MNETPETSAEDKSANERLKAIQLNTWEAELLISALLLYTLFALPDYITEYRRANFPPGSIMSLFIRYFVDALGILRLGYVIHIITRGVWVANVGLSFVFPDRLDLKKMGFKGPFRRELENDLAPTAAVSRLERVASVSYALSFMLSGILLSGSLIGFTMTVYVIWVFMPAMESGNPVFVISAMTGLLVYLLVLLLVFVDFITNGFFRREPWFSKYYYYVAVFFRVISLSFIYNRSLLTVISILPKWKAHLVPFVIVAILLAYKFLDDRIDEYKLENYYQQTQTSISRANYEDQRLEKDPLVVTIPSDLVSGGVLKVFLENLSEFSEINKSDPDFSKEWGLSARPYKLSKVGTWMQVSVDGLPMDSVVWHSYQHPVTFYHGYLAYLPIGDLEEGSHRLQVAFDTTKLTPRQLKVLREEDEDRVVQASILFYKTK